MLQESCESCHGDTLGLNAHGGSRRDVAVCVTCHIAGAEDRYSATDASTTPGATINFSTMAHKIHNGSSLTNGYVLNGYPADADAAGYPDYNAHDYSDVTFPAWPMEGATCASCHEGAADADPFGSPSRAVCGSCHDGVDFATGEGHDGGAMSSDTTCSVCHTASKVEEYHQDPRTDTTVWGGAGHASGKSGVNVTVLSATNGDGDTSFSVGDTITVTFTVTYDDGTPIPQSFFAYSKTSSTCPTVAGAGTAIFAGPSDHLQRTLTSQSAGSSTTVGSIYGSSTVDSSGVWTYTFSGTDGAAQTIPATYPAQYNDSTLWGVDYGDWYGADLEAGTYRIYVDLYTAMWTDTGCGDGSTRTRAAGSDFIDVAVGDATELEPHEIVADSGCESCHQTVEFHGATRTGVQYCTMCHTPGAVDSESAPTTTIDMPVMIHKIHASNQLSESWAIGSHTWDVSFPRTDGGPAACVACHEDNDAYKAASTRACITCHDSTDAAAHAAIMTDDTYGESCDTCHGEGRDYAVEDVHDWAY